jgi:hypothetical protein
LQDHPAAEETRRAEALIMSPFFNKLKDLFNDRQGAAEKKVSKKIVSGADWPAIEKDVFPDKGVGPRLSAVLNTIIEVKRWDLLTPLIAQAGDYLDTVNLVYRPGEFGPVPKSRAQELEDIYNAINAAPKNKDKVLRGFVSCVESWACQRNAEDCFDWAMGKKEAVPVPALGLAALCDHQIDGNPLAMKVLKTAADFDRAEDAIDWVYSSNGVDRGIALDNLADWKKKLEEQERKKNPPAPPTPKP